MLSVFKRHLDLFICNICRKQAADGERGTECGVRVARLSECRVAEKESERERALSGGLSLQPHS